MLVRISLPDELFPVQALINAIPETRFVEALKDFSNGISRGYDQVCFEFAKDSEDDKYDGVRFWIFDEQATISEKEFLKFLRAASLEQIKARPGDASEIERYLALFAERLKVEPE